MVAFDEEVYAGTGFITIRNEDNSIFEEKEPSPEEKERDIRAAVLARQLKESGYTKKIGA